MKHGSCVILLRSNLNWNRCIKKTVRKIFGEAGNRRFKTTISTFDRLRITINSLKLPYEANSKHYEILKILQIVLFRNVFQKRTEKEPVFWSLGLISLSRGNANSTVSRLKCSIATILPMNLCGSWRTPPGEKPLIRGAIHSTKISGHFGPKLNGSVRSNRKSFEKTGPPFEVDQFSRSDRLEFWLNGSRPRYILWVIAGDVTILGHRLGFYQELEIR